MSVVSLIIAAGAALAALLYAWAVGRWADPAQPGWFTVTVLVCASAMLAVAGLSVYTHGHAAGAAHVADLLCDTFLEVADLLDEVDPPAVCR